MVSSPPPLPLLSVQFPAESKTGGRGGHGRDTLAKNKDEISFFTD